MVIIQEWNYKGFNIKAIQDLGGRYAYYSLSEIGQGNRFTSLSSTKRYVDLFCVENPDVCEARLTPPDIPPVIPSDDGEPLPPPDEIPIDDISIGRELVETYKGCIIYKVWLGDDVKFISTCVPDELATLEGIKSSIDTVKGLEVTEFEVSGLPWYLSWLPNFSNWLGLLWSQLTDHAVNRITTNFSMDGILGNFADRVIKNISKEAPDILSKTFAEGTLKSLNILDDVVSHTPEYLEMLRSKLNVLQKPMLDLVDDMLYYDTFIKPNMTNEKGVEGLNFVSTHLSAVHINQFYNNAIVESLSLGQFEWASQIDPMFISKFGFGDLVKTASMLPYEKGLLPFAERYYNVKFPNEIPPYTDLINMVVKEKLSLSDFKKTMLEQGFNNEWSQRIWDSHFNAPSYGDMLKAYYRGGMSYDRLIELLKIVDLDPIYNDEVWKVNIGEIPPYADLINMRVKEVITQKTFSDTIKKHGYDPVWSGRLWDAHFIPPTLGDILLAYRRKVPIRIPEISEDTGVLTYRDVEQLSISDVHKLMELVDLDPRYNSIFDERLYVDPSVREARFMYETGAKTPEQVHEILSRKGYRPADLEGMFEYTIKFREREFQRSYLTALQMGVTKQVFTPEELTSAVVEAGYSENIAEWMIKTADVRRKISEVTKGTGGERILTLGDIKKAYIRDIIDEDTLRTRLQVMGYDSLDIEVLIDILNLDKVTTEEGKKVVALTITQILAAWRYEVISEDEARTKMLLRGLSEDEVHTLMETKRKAWSIGGVI